MNHQSILLAKSAANANGSTLVSHTAWVVSACDRILTSVRESINPAINYEELCLLAELAAVFHDLGKATDLFQDMLTGAHGFRLLKHPVTHEVLSALLLTVACRDLSDWLAAVLRHKPKHWPWMVAWVAGGHHLRLAKDEHAPIVRREGTPHKIIFYGSRVRPILRIAARIIGVEHTPDLPDIDFLTNEPNDTETVWHGSLVKAFKKESEQFDLDEKDQLLIAYAKAIVVAADVAGSALPAGAKGTQTSWINKALQIRLSAEDISRVIEARLGAKRPLRFQEKVASSSLPYTLVVAGCGNGKTIAAYLWAARRAAGRKLFFCYPTTGTATAGFADYLLAQTDMERALIHSRAQVDMQRFEDMLDTDEEDAYEHNQRLESLLAWQQKVVACTVDTVLGVIQNQRRGLFSFPAILNAAIVFDEIHSYDARLFSALLRFLEALPQVPVLLMTASLPAGREQRLRAALGRRLGPAVGGEEQLEDQPRYQLEQVSAAADCWAEVRKALANNKKALWVCNTVKDAISVWEQAKTDSEIRVAPILYHSRFRYRDRIAIQQQVLDAFDDQNMEACLVIATQVCEMSLDINADLLVSALCPFSSLMQRLGRLNRRGQLPHGGRCLVYPFTCGEKRPYRKFELELASKTIGELEVKQQPLSQRSLADALAVLPEIQEDDREYSAWLGDLDDRDLWQSKQRPLREGASVNILLAQDEPDILKKLDGERPTAQTVAAWTIPMWVKQGVPYNRKKLGGYSLIDEQFIEYDSARGAQWRR